MNENSGYPQEQKVEIEYESYSEEKFKDFFVLNIQPIRSRYFVKNSDDLKASLEIIAKSAKAFNDFLG